MADGREVVEREMRVVSDHPECEGQSTRQRRLLIQATLQLHDGSEKGVLALVDTGAEVNLIRRGLIADEYFRESPVPMTFRTADQAIMEGGIMEVPGNLILRATDVDTKRTEQVKCPIILYDASTGVDIILSYEWLQRSNIDVRCKRHGLEVSRPQGPLWVRGVVGVVQQGKIPRGVFRITRGPPKVGETGRVQPVEDYTVRWPFVHECINRLGVEPQRDCFADEGNKRCSLSYTKESDALTRVWPEGEVMWVNPPWKMWPQVAEKVMSSECMVICILPAWSKPWVQQLVGAADRKVYFESGVRMFEVEGKPVPNTLWGVWALRINRGPRRRADKTNVIEGCVFVPRWRPLQAMGTEEATSKAEPGREQVQATEVAQMSGRVRKRALDLFCGTGSVTRELEQQGFEVVTLDWDPKCGAMHKVDLMEWDYRSAYPRGSFEVIFASPPCEHFSRARTTAPRDLELAGRVVRRTLEVIKWFKPQKWFLENPRFGLLREQPYMAGIPWVDVDYCQFSDWGYKKPTRIWGGEHLKELKDCLCDPMTCPNVRRRWDGRRVHRLMLGGNDMRVTRREKCRIPEGLVRYLLQVPELGHMLLIQARLAVMQLNALPEVRFGGELDYGHLEELAMELIRKEGVVGAEALVGNVVVTSGAMEGEEVEQIRQNLFREYASSVFTKEAPKVRPVRGPYGEATIEIKPGAQPTKQRPFHIQGERKEALLRIVDQLIREGKLEEGRSAWSSPAFPVPKKKPGEYRLVVDYRALNDATVTDAHPLPRIEDILQRQGSHKVWTVLDLRDGYHQIPLRREHRPLTCMSTPKGTYQWTVLVMGLKNGGAIFQRTMEWVLKGLKGVDVYIDDVIVGSDGQTPQEVVSNHERDLRAVLDRLAEHGLIVDARKAHMFMNEVEFCGHVLREGTRAPAPGKLLSIQKWELPRTVTQLRGFLGLTNYYSSYIPNYAEYAGPLSSKLQLNRVDGKRGSTKPIVWKESEKDCFRVLKEKLAERLELFRVEPDKPFVLRTDASDKAIGAVLEQHREVSAGRTALVPVAFFSRKLAKGQLNWTPREKETYAVVSALRKWAGWIGLQPVLILTDHKSLEDWVREKMDTPSGPAGRRARWHETLSKFDLTVQYMPGKDNVVADALSRYAYPACKAFQDSSFHGNEEARKEMKAIIAEELREGRTVGLMSGVTVGERRLMFVAGTVHRKERIPLERICVVTRSGRKLDEEEKEEDSDDEVVELVPQGKGGGEERSDHERNEGEGSSSVDGGVIEPDATEPHVTEPLDGDGGQVESGRGRSMIEGEWSEAYLQSTQWGTMWLAIREPQGTWPEGLRVHNGKMVWEGRTCVPETKVDEVLREYHEFMGHAGIQKVVHEVSRRYTFPVGVRLHEAMRAVKRRCDTCQACEPPNWDTKLPIAYTPVPDTIMTSVALDVFALPATEWQGQPYDSLLVCVDRLSGWVIARPCTKVGLTAERAAHMILDNGWESFGIPSIITSDQGSQFVGQWWRTMCARLGIRQAYSQAYRAQANGRAEVAGKSLISILRKMHTDKVVNWVEALPRVLRAFHDNPGEAGLSPFQIVFGRERNTAGVPYELSRECEGAQAFFTRMEVIDRQVAGKLNELHKRDAQRINAGRTMPSTYAIGEWVWVLRPRGSGVSKLDTWWVGPAEVIARTGALSYQVRVKPRVVQDVHHDQLKPYQGDRLEGQGVELFHHMSGYRPMETSVDEWNVESIRQHRRGKDGRWEFLTRWEGAAPGEETWEPAQSFVTRYCYELVKYLKAHSLDVGMAQVLSDTPGEVVTGP